MKLLIKLAAVLSIALFASSAFSMSVIKCSYTGLSGTFEVDLENLTYVQDDEKSPTYDMGTMGHGENHPYFYYQIPPFETEAFLILPRHILDSENYRFTTDVDFYDQGRRELVRCVGVGL